MAATGTPSPTEFRRMVDAQIAAEHNRRLSEVDRAVLDLVAARNLLASGVQLSDGRTVRPGDDDMTYVVTSP